MKSVYIILALMIPAGIIYSQEYYKAGVDTVLFFNPGSGQNAGQSDQYFPANIFGPPSQNASEEFGESTPENILSIGLGGEIAVGFKNYVLIDGPGADLTVFENVFYSPIKNGYFIEPGEVSVSKDGVNWINFPFDSISFIGCSGITPTYGKENPYDPEASGGDQFDLADIGVDSVRYVKIKDVSEIILNNTSHPNYDPTISGFDLDAVVGLSLVPKSLAVGAGENKNDEFEIIGNKIVNYGSGSYKIEIFSLEGRNVKSIELRPGENKTLFDLHPGLYFLSLKTSGSIFYEKIIID